MRSFYGVGALSAADVQTGASLAQDPNALYAAAFGALHLSPSVEALLSPPVRQVFDAAYTATTLALGAASGEVMGALGSAALSTALSVVSPAVVAEVGSVVSGVAAGIGDALPVVNMFVGILQILDALPHASGSSDDGSACAQFWYSMPHPSGPSDPKTGTTAITPADIFSSSEPGFVMAYAHTDEYGRPDADANGDPIMAPTATHSLKRPDSALGACLATITEAGFPSDDAHPYQGGVTNDQPVEQGFHSFDAFNSAFPAAYAQYQAGVGVPLDVQKVFRALRIATASNASDHGVPTYALWMDLLCAMSDAGRLPPGYIVFLLGNHFDGAGNLTPNTCGPSAPSAMAAQIVNMIAGWKKLRAEIAAHKAPIHLALKTNAKLALLVANAKPFSFDPRVTPAARVAIAQRALARGLRPPRPILFSPKLAASLFTKKG